MPATYEPVGFMIEDMPTSVSYDVSTGKDVLGLSFARGTRGESSTSVSPVTVNKKSELAKIIDTIVEQELELSDLEYHFIAVREFKRIGADFETGIPAAYRQKCIVVPGDYAQGNQSLDVSATLNWVGEKKHGTFDGTAFAPQTAVPGPGQIHWKDGDASRSDYKIYLEIAAPSAQQLQTEGVTHG